MPNPQPTALANSLTDGAPSPEPKLEVTAQIISFERGLYSVDVLAPQTRRSSSGMVVPCIRLDPVSTGGDVRAFVSTLSDSPLIAPGDHSTYLRVQGARASILLTIYKLAGGMAAPELRISLVQPGGIRSEPRPAAALLSEPLTVMAHIERAGDVQVQGGLWAGQPGSRGAIEGLSITPGDTLKPDDIEYQAVLGSDWTTPWLTGSEFCGSRGLSLPLLGARIRLRGDAAKSHTVVYWGSFIGTGEVGPVADGAVCSGGGAPLEAIRVALQRRQAHAAATATSQPAAADASAARKPRAPTPMTATVSPDKSRPKSARDARVTTLAAIQSKSGRT